VDRIAAVDDVISHGRLTALGGAKAPPWVREGKMRRLLEIEEQGDRSYCLVLVALHYRRWNAAATAKQNCPTARLPV
jgi:hypothetical protein